MVVYIARLQGSLTEGLPLVKVTILLLTDEVVPLAREGVVNGERQAAHASGGEAIGVVAIVENEAVVELLGGKARSVEDAGHGGESCTGYAGLRKSPG